VSAKVGVVVFPGSNCDRDTLRGLELAGASSSTSGASPLTDPATAGAGEGR